MLDGDFCYASANIKALETLGYAEHICNYLVISDNWFNGKVSQGLSFSNLGLKPLDITGNRRPGYSQCICYFNIKDPPQDVVPVIFILSEDYQLQVALFS
jgi:hypothetical protein